MSRRVFLGGIIPVDSVNMEEVLIFIKRSLEDKSNGVPRIIIAQNATKAAYCYHNIEFRKQMYKADLLIPDGTAILISARILGHRIASRVTGIDVMVRMLHIANSQKRRVSFLGAEKKVCLKLAQNVKNYFPDLTITNVIDGHFPKKQETEIIKSLNEAKPDMFFVALGSPRQEEWLFSNLKYINTKICIGVGGSFDVISGVKKRAPTMFRECGMEGIYRIFREPHRVLRFKPYMTLAHFTARSWVKTFGNSQR